MRPVYIVPSYIMILEIPQIWCSPLTWIVIFMVIGLIETWADLCIWSEDDIYSMDSLAQTSQYANEY